MRKEEINIWELGNKIYIKPKEEFLIKINSLIHKKFGGKKKFYSKLNNVTVPYSTFKDLYKYSRYRKGFHAPLSIFLITCDKLKVSRDILQSNIESYKTQNGYNSVVDPILPIKITPIFDMILAHNIADGTVINSKKNRQLYFGYRQFDKELRILYVKKIESLFGKIKYKSNYFEEKTRPYCPAVLSQLFFNYYNLNSRSFLSKTARLPKNLLNKNKEHLLAVLIAFIIDEGTVDSTVISIRLKNIGLAKDLQKICQKLDYKSTLTTKGEMGNIYILRKGMKKFLDDYKQLIKKYPEISLGNREKILENSFKIYSREIYNCKGNKDLIFNMLKLEDLTVNQISQRINMTRQGVRFHIHNLESENKLTKKGYAKNKSIIYSIGGEARWNSA